MKTPMHFVLSEVPVTISAIKNASIVSIVIQAILGLMLEIIWSLDNPYPRQDIVLFQTLLVFTLIVLGINIFYIWLGFSTEEEIIDRSLSIWVELLVSGSYLVNAVMMILLMLASVAFFNLAQVEDKSANLNRAVLSLLFMIPNGALLIAQTNYVTVVKKTLIVV